VDLNDPFILLVHQGMVEDIFLEDLKARGVEVRRSNPFLRYSTVGSDVEVEYENLKTGNTEKLRTKYLVGCDGAHSKVRKLIPGAEMDGESGKSAWGVLDGEYPLSRRECC
jgi:phenol 2-monooxygenase